MKLYKKNGMREFCPGWMNGLRAISRSCIYAFAGIIVLAAPSAWAHVDPAGSFETGVGLSLTAFRNDGVTPVAASGGTVSQCETIQYRATLSWLGGDNAAFESGSWRVTTPDGVQHDVTPVGGVPCIGGTIDDPNSVANGGRGLCVGSPTSLQSVLISYTVSLSDLVAGQINASTAYGFAGQAYAHQGVADQIGIAASAPFGLTVVTCDDSNACNGGETCDPALVFAAGNGMGIGACVPGTPVNCDDSSACTDDSCDPATGLCANTDNFDCDDSNACTDDSCDPLTGSCVNTSNINCDDSNACTDDSCDPLTGSCVNTGNINCDDSNACTDDSCDPLTGSCVNTSNASCDDSNACTDDSCDPTSGLCVNTDNFSCDDGSACTDDSCDPATGACVNTDNFSCDDGNACTDDSCDPLTGECVSVDNDQSCEPIPTLSSGGLVAMILAMLGLGGILIRRRMLSKAARF